jgi:hypothetical protein
MSFSKHFAPQPPSTYKLCCTEAVSAGTTTGRRRVQEWESAQHHILHHGMTYSTVLQAAAGMHHTGRGCGRGESLRAACP